jgi:hypothetical protein
MKNASVFDEFSLFVAAMNPEKVLTFKASPVQQRRLDTLLEKQREAILTAEERNEVEQYLMLNRIVGLAKAKAAKMIRA